MKTKFEICESCPIENMNECLIEFGSKECARILVGQIIERDLEVIAIRRTELNHRELAIVKIFTLKDDMMSKWLSKQIEWDVLERVIDDIRNELEEQSIIINRELRIK